MKLIKGTVRSFFGGNVTLWLPRLSRGPAGGDADLVPTSPFLFGLLRQPILEAN